MAKEIDLREGMFSIAEDRNIPLGHCAIVVNEEIIYAGRIDESPNNPQTGWLIILHPDDFNQLNELHRKEVN